MHETTLPSHERENPSGETPPHERATPLQDTPPPRKKRETIFSAFYPRDRHLITAILIGANILVFIAMVIGGVSIVEPTSVSLLKWGAIFRPAVLEGQWWRLITACFIHVGILHLLVNMYALLYIGIMLEPLLGRAKFLVGYLIAGVMASLTSVAWNAYEVGAGASGAIFGVYGLFLALLTTELIHPQFRKPLLKNMLFFVVLNLGFGLSVGFVDNSAHIGGLVSGFLLGYAFYPALKRPWDKRLQYLTLVLAVLIAASLTFYVYRHIPRDILVYEQKMDAVTNRDSLARSAFGQLNELPPDFGLSHTDPAKDKAVQKSEAIKYWEEGRQLLTSMDNLKLPSELKRANKKWLFYCELQIRQTELVYRSFVRDSVSVFNGDEIEHNSRQLDTLRKALLDDQ